MVNASPRALAIAAEQVKRMPAEQTALFCPSLIEELPAVVDELDPPSRRHVSGRSCRITARQRLIPRARRPAAVIDDGGTFFLPLAPDSAHTIFCRLQCGGN